MVEEVIIQVRVLPFLHPASVVHQLSFSSSLNVLGVLQAPVFDTGAEISGQSGWR